MLFQKTRIARWQKQFNAALPKAAAHIRQTHLSAGMSNEDIDKLCDTYPLMADAAVYEVVMNMLPGNKLAAAIYQKAIARYEQSNEYEATVWMDKFFK